MKKGGVSSEFIEEVRSKNNLVDIASKYITLTRRGGNFFACCPFHSEKTPSFSIKEDAQIYKCFGCGEGGNVITFIQKMENVDFLTAVEILAKNVGMEMPTEADNAEMQQKKREREITYKILKATTEFYHKNLLDNPNSPQYQYLQKRKIDDEMIQKFQIGASLDFETLPNHLLKLGFNLDDCLKAGVVGIGERGNYYDFYGKRLIFPICNSFGDVVGYSGRSVEDNPNHTKYKNTTQSPVFNKSEILFGYNFVRDQKKQNLALDSIIIVEGHIDVIACHQVGIVNTVGCMGTALTTQHARKIKQLVENVILCLDGDSAGTQATYKAINTLKENNLNVKVVRLVGAKDPDEFIKKYGKDQFIEYLSNAVDCVDFILTDSAKKYDLTSNADRSKYVTESLNYISKFSLEAEQEIYLGVVQKLVKIPIDALRRSLNSNNVAPNSVKNEKTKKETVADNYILESKIMLLASVLYKKISDFKDLDFLFQSEDELSELYNYLKEKIKNNNYVSVSSLFDEFEITNNSLIDRVVNYNFPSDDVYPTFLKDTIKRVELFELKQEKERLTQLMMSSMLDSERYKYLQEIQKITEKIKEKQ